MTVQDIADRLNRLPRSVRWLIAIVILLGAWALTTHLNRPREVRLEAAREALAEAGYPRARLNRAQVPSQMSRCEVGQIRRRGYTYAWRTDGHSGLYCLRLDGRPNRIIVD